MQGEENTGIVTVAIAGLNTVPVDEVDLSTCKKTTRE
jgi:hypothetical protein